MYLELFSYLGIGNKVKVYNHDRLLHFINNRPVGTPLITVCNHTSMLDDPALIGRFQIITYIYIIAYNI